MYWIPKFHKNPLKFRFIVASRLCATKSISEPLTCILKLFLRMHRAYCRTIKLIRNHNRMYIIDNSKPLLDELNVVSCRGNAKSIGTFDFSTLYTSIPLDKLVSALDWVTRKAFKGTSLKYVKVSSGNANFVGSKTRSKTDVSSNCIILSESEVKRCINFLVSNTFFTVGSSTFRQKIGIPMGTDAAPYLANLFLYSYEFSFLEKHNNNPVICRKLSRCFRYIDDLLYVGDPNYFSSVASEIYPPELTLNRENNFSDRATFLDLDINISNGRFVTKLYDKRSDFSFSIVNFPSKSSNIPTTIIHGVIISQVLRFCRACTNLYDFKLSCRQFFAKLRFNGFSDLVFRNAFAKSKPSFRQELSSKYKVNVANLLSGSDLF